MNNLKTYIVIFFLSISGAIAADNPQNLKTKLIEAIQAQPKCDEASIVRQLQSVKIDSDVMYEALRANCTEPVMKSMTNPDIIIPAARRIWADWNHYYPKAKNRLASGGTIDSEDFYHLTYALGSVDATMKHLCEQKHKEACSLFSKIDSEGQSQATEIQALLKAH